MVKQHFHVISTQIESMNTAMDVQDIIRKAFAGMRPDIKFYVVLGDSNEDDHIHEEVC